VEGSCEHSNEPSVSIKCSLVAAQLVTSLEGLSSKMLVRFLYRNMHNFFFTLRIQCTVMVAMKIFPLF
jgi:hypothetical protein